MERRDFVKTTAASALFMSAGSAFAKGHKKHEHHKMGSVTIASTGFKKSRLEDVVEEALECIEAGNICVAHCVRELAKGHTMMAPCQAPAGPVKARMFPAS